MRNPTKPIQKNLINDVYLINACNLMIILCKLKFKE